MRLRSLILLLLLAVGSALFAQPRSTGLPGDKTRVLIILDCSNSMWDRWQSDAKIKVTQKVLLKFLDSVANESEIEVALRVFGHLNKNAYGTRLEVPFEPDNNYKIQSKIKTLVPNGDCTVSSALSNSLNDFPATGASRNIILIITDGMDDCDGNICDVARQVQMSGVIVQTFILGIGSKRDFQSNLDCAGKFTYIPNEENYTATLYDVLRLSEEEARVVVTLRDESGHLFETTTPMAFYDSQTGVVKYTTFYSIDSRYTPDTLTVDPLVDYDIVLHTLPPTRLSRQHFSTRRLNSIDLTLRQGTLLLRRDGRRTNYQVPDYTVLVRRHGDSEILNQQSVGEPRDFLAGRYDVEVLSLPPLRLEDVTVEPSSLTELAIPTPGMANISKPKTLLDGTVFVLRDGKSVYVGNLNVNKVNERILLMPGEYLLVTKPYNSTEYQKVKTYRFQIESAQTTNLNLAE